MRNTRISAALIFCALGAVASPVEGADDGHVGMKQTAISEPGRPQHFNRQQCENLRRRAERDPSLLPRYRRSGCDQPTTRRNGGVDSAKVVPAVPVIHR